ncbi:hypothetical protein DFH11DRAFT_1724424 [Phellopilus nigrolimitatus]|nr:hypothetical protein DFH11DRAFT_1724424 [Phellopilus nigrolimitatus]
MTASAMLSPSSPGGYTRSGNFDIHGAYRRILTNERISTPLAAILALTELIEQSNG